MTTVKLFGCRYSGTKYLAKLLLINWDVGEERKKYGRKHSLPLNVPENMPVIVISKHPAAYVASLRDRRWSKKTPVQTLINDWVAHHEAWLKLTDKQGIAVKHEDLLFSFADTMKKIEVALNMPARDKYINFTEFCGSPKRVVKVEYYRNKEYMGFITPDDQEAIATIPATMLEKLGYLERAK
jgi:hypothetical protein